jgi:hypothetical protein
LLFIDGKLVRKLEPGAYAFWNFQKNVNAQVIELRVQTARDQQVLVMTRHGTLEGFAVWSSSARGCVSEL